MACAADLSIRVSILPRVSGPFLRDNYRDDFRQETTARGDTSHHLCPGAQSLAKGQLQPIPTSMNR